MGVQFNGQVTFNGNVEIFSDGSVKVTDNQININIRDLKDFIERNLEHSPNKGEYIDAARDIEESSDEKKIKEAFIKIEGMTREIGKAIILNGLSTIAIAAIKEVLS